MSIFNDLLLINYYEGVYNGEIEDESNQEAALNFYFNWLVRMAKKYNIKISMTETDENVQEMNKIIEDSLISKLYILEIDDIVNNIVDDLKTNNVKNGRVNDLDIMICCENYLSTHKSDFVDGVYSKLEKEGIEYY